MGILPEDVARKLLGDREYDLRECVTVGWRRWETEVAPLLSTCTPRGRANIVWEFMVDEARRRFPGVATNEEEGRFVLLLHSQLNVVFKKLSEEGLPRNYPTQTALAFSQQPTQLELPYMPDFARITIGYGLNRLGTALTLVSANCFDGERVVWSYSLPERPAKSLPVPFKRPNVRLSKVTAKKADPGDKQKRKRVSRKPSNDTLRVIDGGRKDEKT